MSSLYAMGLGETACRNATLLLLNQAISAHAYVDTLLNLLEIGAGVAI
jgi:hypothetical protein